MRRLAAIAIALLALTTHVHAADGVNLDGRFVQGGLVHGRAPAGARVTLDGQAVAVTPDGRFLLGFGRDHPGRATLSVHKADGRVLTRELAI